MASSGNPLGSLLVRFTGDVSPLSEAIAGMVEEIGAASEEITALGASMAAALPVAAIVTAAAGIVAAAVEVGEEYEEAFNTIIAKTGETGEALTGLKDSFETVFVSVPGNAQAIAESVSLISDRLHLVGDDLTNLATQFAQLASFSGADLASLTDSVTKAFRNWNVSTADQAADLDLLNGVSQKYNVSVTELANGMAGAGNLARLAGESFAQTANEIGLLTSKGFDANEMFAAVSRGIVAANKAGVDLSEVTLANMVYSIEQAIKSGNGLNVALAEFQGRVGPKIYEAVKDGLISSADLAAASLDKATGSIKNTYAETDTLGRQFGLLGKSLGSLNESLGGFLLGAAKDFVHWLDTAVLGLAAGIDSLTGNKKALDEVNAAYAAANPQIQATAVATDGMSLVIAALGDKLFAVQKPLVDVAAKMAVAKQALADATANWKAAAKAAEGFQAAADPLADQINKITDAIQKQQLSAYKKDIDDAAKSLVALNAATGQSLDFKNQQQFFDALAAAFQREHDAIQEVILDNSAFFASMNVFQQAGTIVDDHTKILQQLGVTATTALQAYADGIDVDVQKLFQLQAAGQATEQEVDAGVAKMIAANAAFGQSQDSTELKWKNNTKAVSDLQTAAKRTFDDLSNGLAQAIVQGDSLSKVFLKVAQDISAAIINVAIKQGVALLVNSLGGVLSQLGAIGVAIQKTFGSPGSVASIATPPFSTTSNIPGIGGGAASTAGSVASSAASAGLMGVLGPIGAIGSAVSAVVGIMSMFGVGNSGDQLDRLNIIANNTSDMDWALHGPGGIWTNMWDVRNNIVNLTSAFVGWNRQVQAESRDLLEQIAYQTDVAKGAGGTVVNVTIGTVNGAPNATALAQQLANTIRRYLPQTAAVGV